MAKLTYAVSVFTKGVLSLRSVSLGVLRVDSHRLLEDGIRQELAKKISLALYNGLNFDQKSKVDFGKWVAFHDYEGRMKSSQPDEEKPILFIRNYFQFST